MNGEDEAHYPRFIEQAIAWMELNLERPVSRAELLEADDRLYRINEAYYEEKEKAETQKELDDAEFVHTLRMQEFFEDTFGEDAWDDRHEIYSEIQG